MRLCCRRRLPGGAKQRSGQLGSLKRAPACADVLIWADQVGRAGACVIALCDQAIDVFQRRHVG